MAIATPPSRSSAIRAVLPSWLTTGLLARSRQLLAAAVAVALGAAFLTAVLITTGTVRAATEDAIGAGLRDADLVVLSGQEPLQPEQVDRVSALDGVGRTTPEGVAVATGLDGEYLLGTPVPTAVDLLQGTLPAGATQTAVNPELARTTGVGSTLHLRPAPGPDGGGGPAVDLLVTGIVQPGQIGPLAHGPGFIAPDATLRRVDPAMTYEAVLVDLAPGADAGTVRTGLEAAVPGALVRTGPEAATQRVAGMTGGADVFTGLLVGFAMVALATAALVIANTFSITLAQRTRELALLRCVGASRDQVRRQVLLEALVLGALASVTGVLLGIAVAAALLAWGRRADLGMPLGTGMLLTPVALLLPVLVGTVVTALAGLWPAARATRVAPLAALRPEPTAVDRGRRGLVRGLVGLVILVLGVVLMAAATARRDVLTAALGGLLSFVGVLVASVVLVPAVVRLLGVLARPGGVPARLAVDNAVRNPGRAAATSAALLVGVTLITMTTAGAATGERTALAEINDAYAVDLVATAGEDLGGTGSGGAVDGPMKDVPAPHAVRPGTAAQIADVDGVEAARAVPTAYLTLGEQWVPTLAMGLDESDRDVVNSEDQLAALRPGTLGLGNELQAVHGLPPGSTVRVSGPGGARTLTVVEMGLGQQIAVNAADLRQLAGDRLAEEGAVLVRADARADLTALQDGVRAITDEQRLALTGSFLDRALISKVLDTMVLVSVALLAIAVLIAVVGITNTLSLSILERRQEHALLRGLGLTRGQLRSTLLAEGLLLALVSTILGLGLGLLYARYGIQSLLPGDVPVRLAVPWARVGAIAGVALLAGLLASVLPARRASRVAPAQGLVGV